MLLVPCFASLIYLLHPVVLCGLSGDFFFVSLHFLLLVTSLLTTLADDDVNNIVELFWLLNFTP